MSNISDLREAREAACRRYAAATKEFYAAHINLVALDAATATLAGEPELFRIEGEPSGFSWVDPDEAAMRYAPHYPAANWHTDIQARRDAYIRENRQ
jgi:hypothetical protein